MIDPVISDVEVHIDEDPMHDGCHQVVVTYKIQRHLPFRITGMLKADKKALDTLIESKVRLDARRFVEEHP